MSSSSTHHRFSSSTSSGAATSSQQNNPLRIFNNNQRRSGANPLQPTVDHKMMVSSHLPLIWTTNSSSGGSSSGGSSSASSASSNGSGPPSYTTSTQNNAYQHLNTHHHTLNPHLMMNRSSVVNSSSSGGGDEMPVINGSADTRINYGFSYNHQTQGRNMNIRNKNFNQHKLNRLSTGSPGFQTLAHSVVHGARDRKPLSPDYEIPSSTNSVHSTSYGIRRTEEDLLKLHDDQNQLMMNLTMNNSTDVTSSENSSNQSSPAHRAQEVIHSSLTLVDPPPHLRNPNLNPPHHHHNHQSSESHIYSHIYDPSSLTNSNCCCPSCDDLSSQNNADLLTSNNAPDGCNTRSSSVLMFAGPNPPSVPLPPTPGSINNFTTGVHRDSSRNKLSLKLSGVVNGFGTGSTKSPFDPESSSVNPGINHHLTNHNLMMSNPLMVGSPFAPLDYPFHNFYTSSNYRNTLTNSGHLNPHLTGSSIWSRKFFSSSSYSSDQKKKCILLSIILALLVILGSLVITLCVISYCE